MATRGISAGNRPFPQVGRLKDVGEISDYLNTLGNWIDSAIDGLNRQAKTIPYAAYAHLPPLDGVTRLIAVPDDPIYGQVLCFNGVATSGTATGWYRLIPAGTTGAPAASFPVGGTTSQVLGKHSGTDYDMEWQTPHYVPAGGTTSQALRKTGTADYAAAWADVHEVPSGGGSGDVLSKSGTADYALAWVTPHYLTTGGTTGQVLTKTSTADYAASWQDAQRPAFIGALAYSTSTQTATSGSDLRLAWNAEVYDGASFHDNVTNNSRMTIGSGVSYVELVGNLAVITNGTATAGSVLATIWKNGSAMGTALAEDSRYTVGVGATVYLQVQSPVLAVGSGDYFELNVNQNTGAAAKLDVASANWFALKAVQ